MCVALGGSLTGEHGIGVEKRDSMPSMFSADELDCMRRLRAAFDPLFVAAGGTLCGTRLARLLTPPPLRPMLDQPEIADALGAAVPVRHTMQVLRDAATP